MPNNYANLARPVSLQTALAPKGGSYGNFNARSGGSQTAASVTAGSVRDRAKLLAKKAGEANWQQAMPDGSSTGYTFGGGSGSGGTGGGGLPGSIQEAVAQANAANEARYQQGMGLYDQNIAEAEQYGGAMREQLGRQRTEATSGAQSDLTGRGLANTTIVDSVLGGINRDYDIAGINLEDTLSRYRSDARTAKAGFIERRHDTAPDLALLASLQQQASAAPRANQVGQYNPQPAARSSSNPYQDAINELKGLQGNQSSLPDYVQKQQAATRKRIADAKIDSALDAAMPSGGGGQAGSSDDRGGMSYNERKIADKWIADNEARNAAFARQQEAERLSQTPQGQAQLAFNTYGWATPANVDFTLDLFNNPAAYAENTKNQIDNKYDEDTNELLGWADDFLYY